MVIYKKAIYFLLTINLTLLSPLSLSVGLELPDVCVSGVMLEENSAPRAVINDCIVKQNDFVEGARVVAITESGVKFEYNGEVFEKEIGEGCKTAKSSESINTQEIKGDSLYKKKIVPSGGKLLYERAQGLLKKARELDTTGNLNLAYTYYDKAMKYAQSAIPLVDKEKREGLMEMIGFIRNRTAKIKEAQESGKAISSIEYPKLISPEEIMRWLGKNINYRTDKTTHKKPEYWQTSKETIALKTGDCEDFAFLTQALLQEIGIESSVIGIAYLDPAGVRHHAICIYEDGNSLKYFSVYNFYKAEEQRLELLLPSLYPDWFLISELNLAKRVIIPFFKRGRDKIKKLCKIEEGVLSRALVRILK